MTGTIGTIICIAGSQEINYRTLLAGRMVQGLGSTAWESLSLAAIGDMFYLHERGLRTALVVATLTCTPSLVSIIAGALTQNAGWKAIFVASLPFDVAALLAAVFLLPETQFRRPEAKRSAPATEVAAKGHNGEEKGRATPVETATAPRSVENGAAASPQIPKMTYLQSLAPWTGTYSNKTVLHLLCEVFVVLLNPAVVWIQLVSAVLIALFVAAAYTTAQIWSVPPYNLNVAQNGFFYVGSFLGGMGATVAGPVCDWTARRLSRANRGVFEAEFRIPIIGVGAVFALLGWFLFMWDVNNPRPNGYLLGSFCYGIVCFGISMPSTSAGLYIL